MNIAIRNNERIYASPNEKALCPICKEEVISKCGVVKKWHWSHKSIKDCDTWAEPESEWHLNWKNKFPKEQQEVVIGKHRADIVTKDGSIIELQNSSINSDDICDREIFYNKMIWLLNGSTIGSGFNIKEKTGYYTFTWKNPPQSFFYSDKQIYIDLTKKVEEFVVLEEDSIEKISILYNSLNELLKKNKLEENPNKFNFDELKYSKNKFELGLEEKKEILKIYDSWSELSREHSKYEKINELFSGKSIFLIKKLYKQIPCAGWGYIISEEEFLNGKI